MTKMMNKMQMITGLAFFLMANAGSTQEYYVDAMTGLDANMGLQESPFRTLSRAVRVANEQTGTGDIVIRLMPGIYLLEDRVSINPVRIFDDSSRFIIEALTMPDDSDWSPEKMPVIQSISPNNSSTFFDHAVGFLVASNKVTIRGLKFLGNANPSVNYYYPITKEDKSIEDLEVSQCMFIGDKESTRIQGGVWAHGPNNSVDHCVFYECRNAVLFFDNINGFRISNTIVLKSYESAFWLGPDDVEFEFTNNIIAHNNNVIVGRSESLKYSSFFEKSIIANNDGFVGYWSREKGKIINIKSPNIQLKEVIDKGFVEVHENNEAVFDAKHLHLTEASVGSIYNAGIFKKK